MSKQCTKCQETKPLDEFHRQRSRPDGRHSWCKTCANKARRNRKPDHPAMRRKHNLKKRYGITPAEHREMLESQGGVCAICHQKMDRVCVDHCHTTGAVRGLLCHGCNIKLPAVEDETYRKSALRYLRQST